MEEKQMNAHIYTALLPPPTPTPLPLLPSPPYPPSLLDLSPSHLFLLHPPSFLPLSTLSPSLTCNIPNPCANLRALEVSDFLGVLWLDKEHDSDAPQRLTSHLFVFNVVKALQCGLDLGCPLFITETAFLGKGGREREKREREREEEGEREGRRRRERGKEKEKEREREGEGEREGVRRWECWI